ncbi:unnamed protein product [Cylicostephanus goldi]|uniref:Secreted protein n=1 Tax=Cylicostephanus goldi TaxID=71465 RepID=A0A3P6TH21_CYLGO|nr:unnamed protein product [Cylicostephanus goldi]
MVDLSFTSIFEVTVIVCVLLNVAASNPNVEVKPEPSESVLSGKNDGSVEEPSKAGVACSGITVLSKAPPLMGASGEISRALVVSVISSVRVLVSTSEVPFLVTDVVGVASMSPIGILVTSVLTELCSDVEEELILLV